jgi:hypothetical protein
MGNWGNRLKIEGGAKFGDLFQVELGAASWSQPRPSAVELLKIRCHRLV